MADLNEWAKNLDAGIEAKIHEESRSREELAARRALVDSQASALWEALLQSFRDCCAAINARGRFKLVAALLGPDMMIIRRDGGVEALQIRRDPQTKSVAVGETIYRVTVIPHGDGKAAYSRIGGGVRSCLDIAQESLASLLKTLRY